MKSMYASRSVPVLNTPVPNAAYVDDSSSQNESLQRKADMANGAVQRVVQRETGVVQRTGEADGKFKYVANLNDNVYVRADKRFKKSVPYNTGLICFSEYKGAYLESAGFTGCIMMAFHFNPHPELITLFTQGIAPVNYFGKKYIAHVYCASQDDTKEALFDAEKRGLITIEAMFKPFKSDDANPITNAVLHDDRLRSFTPDNTREVKDCSFRGRMATDHTGQWIADVFVENKKIYECVKDKFIRYPEKKKIKHYDSADLKYQTITTKAYLYASIVANGANDRMKLQAKMKLLRIANRNKHALIYARQKLSDNAAVNGVLGVAINNPLQLFY